MGRGVRAGHASGRSADVRNSLLAFRIQYTADMSFVRDMADIEVDWDVEGIIAPKESVTNMLKVIEDKGKADSGTFWRWDGRVSHGQASHSDPEESLTRYLSGTPLVILAGLGEWKMSSTQRVWEPVPPLSTGSGDQIRWWEPGVRIPLWNLSRIYAHSFIEDRTA